MDLEDRDIPDYFSFSSHMHTHSYIRYPNIHTHSATENYDAEKSERLQQVYTELDSMGAAAAEAKARTILFGLGFPLVGFRFVYLYLLCICLCGVSV